MKVALRLEPRLATLFNPLGAGIRWTTTVGGAGEGDIVAVLGPGVRGLSACVAAKEAGAAFVAVTGVGPRDRERFHGLHSIVRSKHSCTAWHVCSIK